jgi:hypothetical protein
LDLNSIASELGLSFEVAKKALEREAASAAGQGSSPHTATMPDKTLARRLQRYEERLAAIELPAEGFTRPEQAKAAKNLADAFQALRDRQLERGLEPTEKDRRVTEADRLRVKFERDHKKAQESRPPRPGTRRSAIVVKKTSPHS